MNNVYLTISMDTNGINGDLGKHYDNVGFLENSRFVGTAEIITFVNCLNIKKIIDFTGLTGTAKNGNQFLLRISNSDISNFRINYLNCKLVFFDHDSYDKRCSIYENLLLKFQKDGFLQSYEKLDIEYKKFKNHSKGKWIIDWIEENWWNYGYNKPLIIRNTIIILFLFTFINFFNIKTLLVKVYPIKNIILKRRSYFWNNPALNFINVKAINFILCVIYTSVIFFGLKLDVNNMKFDKIGWVVYIYSVYVVGIICNAFLLNLIIK